MHEPPRSSVREDGVRPLSDPLMTVKPWLKGLGWLSLVSGVLLCALFLGTGDGEALHVGGLQLLSAGLIAVVVLLALPRRRPDIFYLRSFRKDRDSYLIRDMIEVALGADLRLAGIRDPKRRMPLILRPLLMTVMMLQYAGARYLNLEAGDDWKARLWCSLRLGRGAILDLRDQTPFVKEEVDLALATLGPGRVLFLTGDDGKSGEAGDREAVRSLRWSDADRQDPEAFIGAVQEFVRSLDGAPEPAADSGFDLARDHVLPPARRRREQVLAWVQILAGFAAVTWLSVTEAADIRIVLAVLSAIIVPFVFVLLVRALIGKAMRMRLARRYNPAYLEILRREFMAALAAVAVMAVGFLVAGFVTWSAYQDLVGRAKAAAVYSDLRQLALGAEMYRVDLGRYPPLSGDVSALIERPGGDDGNLWGGPYFRARNQDPWGEPYHYVAPEAGRPGSLGSSGPDRQIGTADDLVVPCCRE